MLSGILCFTLGIWCPPTKLVDRIEWVSPAVVAERAMEGILPTARPFTVRVPCSNGDSSDRINHAIIFAAAMEDGYSNYVRSLGMYRRWTFPVVFGACTYTIRKIYRLPLERI